MGKEKKYKIGMASKYVGVSPQTVRYYEKQELFASLKEEFSTTRYYDARHFKWLSNIRRFFRCGFSEKEVHQLLNSETLEEMQRVIDRRIDASRVELQEVRTRIEAMERMSCDIRKIPALLGKVAMEENPEMSILITREGNRMLEEEETERMLCRWLDQIQSTSVASVIPQEVLCGDPESSYRLSGHCMPTHQLRQFGWDENDPVLRTIKPRLCLHTICEMRGEDLSPRTLMPHVYEYVRDFALQICGDAFGQSLAVLKETDNVEYARPKAAYYEYWIPVCRISNTL